MNVLLEIIKFCIQPTLAFTKMAVTVRDNYLYLLVSLEILS